MTNVFNQKLSCGPAIPASPARDALRRGPWGLTVFSKTPTADRPCASRSSNLTEDTPVLTNAVVCKRTQKLEVHKSHYGKALPTNPRPKKDGLGDAEGERRGNTPNPP